MTGTAEAALDASGRTSVVGPEDRALLLTIAVAAATTFFAGFVAPPDGLDLVRGDAAQARAWLETGSAALHAATIAVVTAAVGLVVVAAAMSALLRRHRPGSPLSEMMLGGAVATAIVLVLDVATQSVGLLLPGLVGTSTAEVDDTVVVGWVAVAGVTHLLGDFQVAFLALVLLSGSWAALQLRLMSRWLCYGGLAVAAAAVLGTLSIALGAAALYPFWFLAVFGFYASMLVLAVASLLARRRAGRPEQQG